MILLLFLLSLYWFCGCKNSFSPADSSGLTTKTQETSAGEQDSGAGEEPAQKPQTYLGNDTLTFTYSEADYRALESEIDQWYRLFEAGNDPDGFLELYEQMEEGSFSKLDDQKTVAYILFSLDLQNESVKQQYLEMEKRATAASRRICALYDDINDSAYKDSFFAEWSDEDIRRALKSAKASTDEFEQLSNAYTELTVTYAALPDDANYLSASAQLYMQAISLNKQMAQLMGYDNYMDYAYDYVYYREGAFTAYLSGADIRFVISAEAHTNPQPPFYMSSVIITQSTKWDPNSFPSIFPRCIPRGTSGCTLFIWEPKHSHPGLLHITLITSC